MKRISQRATIIAVSAALALQLGSIWLHKPAAQQRPYKQVRSDMVVSNAATAKALETVVLGDSISEMIWLDGACGKTLNASVAGARVHQISDVGARVFQYVAPKKIVVAIGTNDAIQNEADDAVFRQRYDDMITRLPIKPAILVGITISKKGDAYIQQKAKQIGAEYLPPLPDSLTTDGIHPNAEGGRMWRNNLVRACKNLN